jgi:hypothetical protein
MKTVKRATVMALIVFAIGFAPTSQAREKGSYLGDYCWNITYPLFPGFVDVLQLGVYDVGGGHHALYGTMTLFDDSSALRGTAAMNGNMETVGGEVLVTATAANTLGPGAHNSGQPHVLAGTLQATLDAGTLDGTVYIIVIGQNLNTLQIVTGADTGTMTFTSCP